MSDMCQLQFFVNCIFVYKVLIYLREQQQKQYDLKYTSCNRLKGVERDLIVTLMECVIGAEVKLN